MRAQGQPKRTLRRARERLAGRLRAHADAVHGRVPHLHIRLLRNTDSDGDGMQDSEEVPPE